MTVSKPMQTEFGIHHRLESCVQPTFSYSVHLRQRTLEQPYNHTHVHTLEAYLCMYIRYNCTYVHSVLFRPASPFWGLVLVYYYTGICDVTVTKWNLRIGLVLPFKGCRSRKNWVYGFKSQRTLSFGSTQRVNIGVHRHPYCRGIGLKGLSSLGTASHNSTKPLFEPLTESIRSYSLAVYIKSIDTSPGLTEQVLMTFFMTWHFKWPWGHVWPQKRPKLSRPQKSTKVGSNWSLGPQKSFA